MNRCEFIDVKSIIKIVYTKEWKHSYIEWEPEKIEKGFLGLFKPDIYPEGFYDITRCRTKPYEISSIEKDYNIKDNIVYNKPRIEIHFNGCSDETIKKFDTNNEAEEYILMLENMAGKKFVCVTK